MSWRDYIPFVRKAASPMEFPQIKSAEGRSALGIGMAGGNGEAPKTSRARIEAVSRHTVAYWCIRKIATAAASVPWIIEDGRGNEIPDHPMLQLLASPNAQQSKSEFFQTIAASLATTGNAYIKPIFSAMDENRITAIYALRPDRVQIVKDETDQTIVKHYIYHGGARSTEFITPDRMCHIKHSWLLDEVEGYAPINSIHEAVVTYSGFQKLVSKILGNSGGIPGLLVFSTKRQDGMSEEQRNQMQEHVNSFKIDGDNFGKLLLADVGDGDVKFVGLAGNMAGLDQKQAKAEAARDICLGYGVPPNLYLSEDQKYANYQEANRVFWLDTVLPAYLDPIAQALGRFFNVSIKPDLSEVPALTAFNEETLRNLSAAQSMLTVNEMRAKLGYRAVAMGDRVVTNPAAIALDTQLAAMDAKTVLSLPHELLSGILEADMAARNPQLTQQAIAKAVAHIAMHKAASIACDYRAQNGTDIEQLTRAIDNLQVKARTFRIDPDAHTLN